MNTILRRSLFCASLAGSLFGLSTAASAEEKSVASVATAATAEELMAVAHHGRGEWTQFPGFEANIVATSDGSQVAGKLIVTRDGKISVETTDGNTPDWLQRTLNSVIGHRLTSHDAITGVAFADDQIHHPHGRLLKSTTEGDPTLWRVQGDVLTEVQRFSENSRFTISVGDVWRNAEGKHLPQNYQVTTWELPSNQIKSVRQIHNEWTRVEGIDLPTLHLAVTSHSGKPTTSQQIRLTGHKLLRTN